MTTDQAVIKIKNHTDSIKSELSAISDLFNTNGLNVDLANFDPIPEKLNSVNPQKLERAETLTREFKALLISAIEHDVEIQDSKSFIGFFLERLGLHCCPVFFETLSKDNEVVEAYDTEHLQIFRNFTFMKVCGYSLADILTFEWPDLFERSNVITQKIIDGVHSL